MVTYDFLYLDLDLPELIYIAINSLLHRYSAKYPMEVGRNRAVFLAGNYVIKIPLTDDGFVDNDWEGSISNSKQCYNHPDWIQYPRTRLVCYNEIPIVLAQKVRHVWEDEIKERLGFIPDWIYSVDCGQVGFTKNNRLVAYDYGRT